ncbi:MAG: tetratricopeptide repeat protein [Myxococcaceae bacterium]|nr:tetratricopeptide repeat protein [Myxococcaceae bacterium]
MATTARAQANEEEFLSALYKGGELLAAGKIVDARAHLEKANQLSPKNEKAQNLLGLTYFKLGLFDEASDIYERLVRENPVDPTLRVNLGLVYLKTNNLPRCIKEFETATDLDPEHKKAHNYLGLALAQAGDYGKAREHFVLAGSDQMAEKMSRALATKVETTPAMVLPSAPPATAHAVTARPAEALPTVDVTRPPPLPPPPAAEEEIEVMSDEEVVSGELAMPGEPPPPPPPPEPQLIETEPMPAEVEVPPPAPSGPRLDRDWGAQFGMDEAPAPADVEGSSSAEIEVTEALPVTEAAADELPVIEANAEFVPAPKKWSTPLVNSWDAASGMTPPPRDAVAADVPLEPPPYRPEHAMESTHDPAADDPMWHAAKGAATEAQPAAQDLGWNVPPDPARELDFGDVAPTDAVEPPAREQQEPVTAYAEASLGQPAEQQYSDQAYAEQATTEQPPAEQHSADQASTDQAYAEQASSEQPYTEQPYTEQAYTEQPYGDQPYAEQPPSEQTYTEQPYTEPPSSAEGAYDSPESAGAEAQSWAEQPPATGTDASEQTWTASAAHPAVEASAAAEQPWTEPDGALPPFTDSPTEPYGRMTEETRSAEPAAPEASAEAPPDQAWVAQPLSQFSPDAPPPPRPPPSAPHTYSPMQARTLVELGETTSDIEQPNAGPFHVGPQGLAITVNGQMLSRMSNLVAIVGSVTATPEPKRARGRATEQPFGDGANQVQRLVGHGVVHLEMGGARFHALDLNDESAYLREERVFGFEETIGFEHGTLTDEAQKLRLDLVHLSGDGRVLLQLGGAMKALAIPAGEPMVVPLQRLVGWFGRVSPRLTGFAGQGAVELTGDGYALLVTPG